MQISATNRPLSLQESIERASRRSVPNFITRVMGYFQGKVAVRQLALLHRKGNLTVGKFTYGTPRVFISHPLDNVSIGSFSSIAPEVTLIPGGIHPMRTVSTFPFRKRLGLEAIDSSVTQRGPIIIGNDVWLGTGALVLSGVTIGTGAVVAAGGVVTRDVAPYSVVAGVPARQIDSRFSEEEVELLMASKWWLLPDDFLKERISLLEAGDIRAFISSLSES